MKRYNNKKDNVIGTNYIYSYYFFRLRARRKVEEAYNAAQEQEDHFHHKRKLEEARKGTRWRAQWTRRRQ
jgi:hypothetical protein